MGKGGYVAEFVRTVWKPLMNEFISRKIKIVTNAGGFFFYLVFFSKFITFFK